MNVRFHYIHTFRASVLLHAAPEQRSELGFGFLFLPQFPDPVLGTLCAIPDKIIVSLIMVAVAIPTRLVIGRMFEARSHRSPFRHHFCPMRLHVPGCG